MHQSDVCALQSLMPVKRRSLLAGIGSVALIAGSGIGLDRLLAAPVATTPSAAFVEMGKFVTGSNLTDEAAIARAWSQLVALDGGFAAAVDRLQQAVRSAELTSMAAFEASPLTKDATLVKTATTIISAFYLGYTGTPIEHRVKDDTGFVTFVGALMWRPTIDATVIPTFARGGTNYWVQPPAGTPVPKGPQGQADWRGSTVSSNSSKA